MFEFFRIAFEPPRMLAGSDTAEVMLYGEIVEDYGKWYKEEFPQDKSAANFDAAIKAARAGGATRLLLRINSPGGFAVQGIAMRSILAQAGFEQITVRIEGLCASAATIPATLPGARVEIAPMSEYMIHNPWAMAVGDASAMQKAVNHLRDMEASFAEMYAARTGRDAAEMQALMDAETWLTAKQAVEYGFADAITEEEKKEDEALPIAACVSPAQMRVMQSLYRRTKEAHLTVKEPVSPAPAAVAATPSGKASDATEYIHPEREESTMELREITEAQLRAENPALVESIAQAAVDAERARVQEIDELTMPGYEAMAQQAKASGQSAMDFHKALAKAQRERGTQFLAQREQETAPAVAVRGGAAEDQDSKDEIDAYAKEIADYAAKAGRRDPSMF